MSTVLPLDRESNFAISGTGRPPEVVMNQLGIQTNLRLIISDDGLVDPWAKCENTNCRRLFADSTCDTDCNTAMCAFDGGDCGAVEPCPNHCRESYNDGSCNPICERPECLFDGRDCLPAVETRPSLAPILLFLQAATDVIKVEQRGIEWDLGVSLNAIVDVVAMSEFVVENRRRSGRVATEAVLLVRPLCTFQCFKRAEEVVAYLNAKTASGQLSDELGIVSLGARETPPDNPDDGEANHTGRTVGLVLGVLAGIGLVACVVMVLGRGASAGQKRNRDEPDGGEVSPDVSTPTLAAKVLKRGRISPAPIAAPEASTPRTAWGDTIDTAGNGLNKWHMAAAAGSPEDLRRLLRRRDGDGEPHSLPSSKGLGNGSPTAALQDVVRSSRTGKTECDVSETPLGRELSLPGAAETTHVAEPPAPASPKSPGHGSMSVRSEARLAPDGTASPAQGLGASTPTGRGQILAECDVRAVDARGNTPLHFAALCGSVEKIALLVLNGGSIDACDAESATPLHLACRHGHQSGAEKLLELHAGADAVTTTGMTPLHEAVAGGHGKLVRALCKHPNVAATANIPDAEGIPPLVTAAKGLHGMAARALLQAGARPDGMDKRSWTALHWAAVVGDERMITLLHKFHADINVTNKFGESALMLATREGNSSVVQVLLENFAKRNLEDKSGQRALDIAKQRGFDGISALLQDWTVGSRRSAQSQGMRPPKQHLPSPRPANRSDAAPPAASSATTCREPAALPPPPPPVRGAGSLPPPPPRPPTTTAPFPPPPPVTHTTHQGPEAPSGTADVFKPPLFWAATAAERPKLPAAPLAASLPSTAGSSLAPLLPVCGTFAPQLQDGASVRARASIPMPTIDALHRQSPIASGVVASFGRPPSSVDILRPPDLHGLWPQMDRDRGATGASKAGAVARNSIGVLQPPCGVVARGRLSGSASHQTPSSRQRTKPDKTLVGRSLPAGVSAASVAPSRRRGAKSNSKPRKGRVPAAKQDRKPSGSRLLPVVGHSASRDPRGPATEDDRVSPVALVPQAATSWSDLPLSPAAQPRVTMLPDLRSCQPTKGPTLALTVICWLSRGATAGIVQAVCRPRQSSFPRFRRWACRPRWCRRSLTACMAVAQTKR